MLSEMIERSPKSKFPIRPFDRPRGIELDEKLLYRDSKSSQVSGNATNQACDHKLSPISFADQELQGGTAL
jgi:hypothetical protein